MPVILWGILSVGSFIFAGKCFKDGYDITNKNLKAKARRKNARINRAIERDRKINDIHRKLS